MKRRIIKHGTLLVGICIINLLLSYQISTAQQAQQIGTQEILVGGIDIFYNDYPDQISDILFTEKFSQTVEQGTVANYAGLSTWPEEAFIGIIDLNGTIAPWNLSIQGPALLTDSTKTINLSGSKLKAETSAHKWTTLTLSDSNSNIYVMTKNTNATEQNNIWYWQAPSYTWANGDVIAQLNTPSSTDLSNPVNYNTGIVSAPTTILAKESAQTAGIFGIGISFALIIPGGTPEGNYTGTITYTLS